MNEKSMTITKNQGFWDEIGPFSYDATDFLLVSKYGPYETPPLRMATFKKFCARVPEKLQPLFC